MLKKYFPIVTLAILSLLLCASCGKQKTGTDSRTDLGIQGATDTTTSNQSIIASTLNCTASGPATVGSGQMFSVVVSILNGAAPYGISGFSVNSSNASNTVSLRYYNNTSGTGTITSGGSFVVTALLNGVTVQGNCPYYVQVSH